LVDFVLKGFRVEPSRRQKKNEGFKKVGMGNDCCWVVREWEFRNKVYNSHSIHQVLIHNFNFKSNLTCYIQNVIKIS